MKSQIIGSVESFLSTLVVKMRNEFEIQIKSGNTTKKAGDLFVTATKLGTDRAIITLRISGFNLDHMNGFMKRSGSNPFLEISKRSDSGHYSYVTRTNVLKIREEFINTLWDGIQIPIGVLCNGDYSCELKFTLWNHVSSTKKYFMGEFKIEVFELIERMKSPPLEFDIINENNLKKKEQGKTFRTSGKIVINKLDLDSNYSFLDYIQSGIEICGEIAIDFTASNGDQGNTDSLHYFYNNNFQNLNSYEQAIWGVVNIIQEYDTDKKFPTWGFGAKLLHQSVANHAFNVNLTDDPDCDGTIGVLRAYRYCLTQIRFSKPTNFEPVLNKAISNVQQHLNEYRYYIFLILTDGAICDLNPTKAAIARASVLPMSIIIVGISSENSNFASMKILDNDDHKILDVEGKPIKDIVQFVEFKGPVHFSTEIAYSSLARDVLAEVPDQFIAYMKLHKIVPRNTTPYNYDQPASTSASTSASTLKFSNLRI